MDETLRIAVTGFISALHDAGREVVEPLDAEGLADVEGYIGRPFPEPWRTVLAEHGWGSKAFQPGWPDPNGQLLLDPMEGAEHQVETDDGIAIADAGRFVIGYIGGIGDCVVLDPTNTHVFHHSHGGEDRPLGTLTEFFETLTDQVQG